ncbi:PAS domain-containing protein [Colwelliaceae bacterium 6471]
MPLYTDALKKLQIEFKKSLPDRIDAITSRYKNLSLSNWQLNEVKQLHLDIHSLTGAAGTFGIQSLSVLARQIEVVLKSVVEREEVPNIETWQEIGNEISRLKQVAQNAIKDSSHNLMPPEKTKISNQSPLIYIVEDDDSQAQQLMNTLKRNGYQTQIFNSQTAVQSAWENPTKPDALLIDINLSSDNEGGFRLLEWIQKNSEQCPPVVIASVYDDLDTRLRAYRAGAARYFCKPLVTDDLVTTLDQLTGRIPTDPYRILLVDDDRILLKLQTVALEQSGMLVESISEPRKTLQALDTFKPDVLLLDVYMPDINGPELAAVVRERHDNLHLPIIFLSAETDVSAQLKALSLGGDDFLIKPIKPEHLVSAVTTRARRARQANVLYNRLKLNLYEREREHLALNKHALVSITNRKGDINYVNDTFCKISGYSRNELLGQNHRIVKSGIHPPKFYEDIWHTIVNGDIWQGEICNLNKNGDFYWVSSTIMPLVDDNGNAYQYVSIRTDITQQKEAEQQQRKKIAIQTMLSEAAGLLLLSDYKNLDNSIRQALALAGKCLGVDRASLFLNSSDGRYTINTLEWNSPDSISPPHKLKKMELTDAPWWFEQLGSGNTIKVPDVVNLPKEAAKEKTMFESFGITSISALPLQAHGAVKGFVVFEHTAKTMDFGEEQLSSLAILTNLLSGALLRAKSEEKAALSAMQLNATLDSTKDGILAVDSDGQVLFMNEQFRNMWGVPKDLIDDTDDQSLLEYSKEKLLDPKAFFERIEYLYQSDEDSNDLIELRDGRIFERFSRVFNKQNIDENKPSRVWSFHDITERHVAELSATAAKERLRRGQEYANIGTWEWDIESGDLYWTERIAPLFGYQSGTLETSYENFMGAIHPDDRLKVSNAVNACVELDEPYDIEHRVVWPNGNVRWLHERGAVQRDSNGKAERMIGVVQDIDIRKRTELALDKSKQELLQAQHLAKLGNWSEDLITGELTWSDEVYRIFGDKPNSMELSAELFRSKVHPDDLTLFDEARDHAKETGHFELLHRIVLHNNNIRYVQQLGSVARNSDGLPITLFGTLQDVTERIEAEQRLREYQERFTFAIEGAGDGVWDWDVSSGKMLMSGHYEPMLGYEFGELEPNIETWLESVYPDDLEHVESQLNEYIEGKRENYNIELRLLCKNGSYKWVLCRGTIVERDKDGRPSRLIGIHSDIDERKKSERTLHLFKHVVTSMIDGVIIINPSGIVQMANPPVSAIFGYDDNTLIGKNVSMLMPAKIASQHDAFLQRYINTREGRIVNRQIEVTAVKRDGTEFPIELAVSEILVDEDSLFVGLVRDITDRKLSEQQIIEAREQADRANQAKSEFLSSMSHELRTPMNAILGFGQLMEYDDTLPDDHKDSVNEILKAGQHLLELINEVLDLAKVESGKLSLSIEPIEVCSIIEECVSLVDSMAVKRDVNVTYHAVLNVIVKADRTRLKQVLLNILSNAIKYNREGGCVTIELEIETENKLTVHVKDTGFGIPESKIKDLFIPFNRLDADSSNIEGTGIGLTITKRIVEMMGGAINVESEYNKGSTFSIILPLTSLSDKSYETDDVSRELLPLHEELLTEPTDKTCYTVIYIEDNPANIRLITQVLRRTPHIRLLTALSSSFGVELVTSELPDLILLDINMPDMDGFQVMKILQSTKELKNIPVIAITANAMSADIERGKQAGFVDYLTKPINIPHFLNAVESHLPGEHDET